jgi:hypothetical protein
MENFIEDYPWVIAVFIILAVWDAVWKLIAYWKSARSSQLAWFICIAIFNTVGILPIIYLIWFQKKPAVEEKVT